MDIIGRRMWGPTVNVKIIVWRKIQKQFCAKKAQVVADANKGTKGRDVNAPK